MESLSFGEFNPSLIVDSNDSSTALVWNLESMCVCVVIDRLASFPVQGFKGPLVGFETLDCLGWLSMVAQGGVRRSLRQPNPLFLFLFFFSNTFRTVELVPG